MKRFNLVSEPWIAVMEKESDEIREISLSELFINTGKYRCLSGEMEIQNFAVMRMILAVIHTVFSRFDVNGDPLFGISLDDRYVQTENVNEDDIEEYAEAVKGNWFKLYSMDFFPEIVNEYLEKQKDRFFLFSDKNPFYQVDPEEMKVLIKECNNDDSTSVMGKTLNRTISESEHVKAFFAPVIGEVIGKKTDNTSTKDLMSESELARRLITYQEYAGTGDKASLVREVNGVKQSTASGWLYEIGGVYLKGKDLHETLVLNYIPVIPVEGFIGYIQRPCWEKSGIDNVRKICDEIFIDNYAELYTNWSRALSIKPDMDMDGPVSVSAIKLPGITKNSRSIEPMTVWKYHDSGKYKGVFRPARHKAEKSLWRSFGAVVLPSFSDGKEKHIRPRIFDQYELLSQASGERWTDIEGIGLIDNGQQASLTPVDEVYDSFQVNDLILTDQATDGWITRIADAVETTKAAISEYELYFRHIYEIRGLKDDICRKRAVDRAEEIYSQLDLEFKSWLASIEPGMSKDDKIGDWYSYLKKILTAEAEFVFENCSTRDMKGIKKNGRTMNITTEYNLFMRKLNKIL